MDVVELPVGLVLGGAQVNFPRFCGELANRKRRGRRGGRPPAFDPAAYRDRNQVERGFSQRKHWRGLATRFDKLAAHYQPTLDLVETLDWLRAIPDHQDRQDRT